MEVIGIKNIWESFEEKKTQNRKTHVSMMMFGIKVFKQKCVKFLF